MISIVVCTFNRAGVLRKMLDSFLLQKHLNDIEHELLIVDNNSDDNTAAVAHEFSSKGKVNYFLERNQGLSFARNRGIAESRGEFVSFLDDDVLVQEHWLVRLKACFEETNADVIGGKVALRFETPPERWFDGLFRKCLSEVDLGASRQVLTDGDLLYGANLSFQKKTLESVGHFETNAGRRGDGLMSGEETELIRRVIARAGIVVYDPEVFVEHLIGAKRLQWQYFVSRARGDGLTREFLDPKASTSLQFLRVCKATMGFLKVWLIKATRSLRSKDSYERRLAEFIVLRQHSFLAARFARLRQQLGTR